MGTETQEPKRHSKRTKVGQLAAEHEAKIGIGKVNYKEADEALDQILELASPGDEIEMPDGTLREIADNFIDAKTGQPKNKAWKPCGVNRFSLAPKAKTKKSAA